MGGTESVHSGGKIVEPGWGRFDTPYDSESVWGFDSVSSKVWKRGSWFYLKLAIGIISWWLNIMEVVLGTHWCTHALLFVRDILSQTLYIEVYFDNSNNLRETEMFNIPGRGGVWHQNFLISLYLFFFLSCSFHTKN